MLSEGIVHQDQKFNGRVNIKVIDLLGVDVEFCLPALGAICRYKKYEEKRNRSA
jgi:hypothetical protein